MYQAAETITADPPPQKDGSTLPSISGFSREMELGGANVPTRTLDFEMKMTRSAGIKRRHDGGGPPAPLGVGELVPTQTETHGVLGAVFVRMPNLNAAAAKRLAANVEYELRPLFARLRVHPNRDPGSAASSA